MLTGKPVITVIFSGRPLLLSETAERSEALIQAWFPGTEGGRAVADLITGKTEPQGRLTMSFPRNMGQIPLYYNAFSTGRPVTENPDYMKDLAQSFINMATTVPVILFMSIFCAVLLNQNFRGRGIARVIFFIPIVYASSAMLNVDTGDVMQQAMQNSSYAVESSKGMAGFQMAELISQIGLPDDFIEIIGKIDRVDIGKSQDKTYFRIIDYKSSIKNIDLNEVEAGLQIQLLTYLDAMTKGEDMIPAGVLYFHLIDPIVKANKNMSEEDIEQEIKKKFKMQGLVLADVNVVKMMDQNLEKGASNVIPAYLDKEGNLNKHRSSVITQEQFQDLQRYIHITIQQIAKEMLSGRIDVKPYYSDKKKQTPCQFCQYHAICQFDTTCPGNEYQFIPNQDKEIVFERMKKKD